jgi:outer membrane lipoprotein carrier protein
MKKSFSMFLVLLATVNCAVYAEISDQTATSQESKDPTVLLAEVRKDLSALKAEFIQYELTLDNEKLDMNSGTVWMHTPDRFRWQYKEPIEQLIVADGKQVWVYDEDLEQVTVKAQDNGLNPIYVIINDELSQQHYNIKFEVSNQNSDWLSLTPKVKSEEVKAVWLAVETGSIKQIKVFNHFDQTMVFEFNHIEKNPQIENELFSFTPPEGVDVIQALSE